jgi:hypothetical protein
MMKILSVGPDPNYVVVEKGKMFRKISHNMGERWKRFAEFIGSNDFKLLCDSGFIPKHDRPITMDGEAFLPVERIKHFTKATEWTQSQVIEATLLSVRLNIFMQIIESEFRAIDCHLGNVTYLYSKPIYIDIGSFSDVRFDMIKDHLLMDIEYLGLDLTEDLFHNYNLLSNYIPKKKTTEWENYDSSTDVNIPGPNSFSKEEKLIGEWIDKIKPESVFDAGANAGRLSRQIAVKDIDVVSADITESACDRNREAARELGLKITTALLDLSKPGKWIERLKCDTALVSSVTHHLFRHGMGWEQQAELWDEIAEKYLLIEFIDRTDVCLGAWELGDDYTYPEFIKSLKNWVLEAQESPENPERKWCLFRRKEK